MQQLQGLPETYEEDTCRVDDALHLKSFFTSRSTMKLFVSIGYTLLGAVAAGSQASNECKTFPGDKSWPLKSEWNNLNKTVGGRLVATVPLGASCHGSTFDDATCKNLQEQWQYERVQRVYLPTTIAQS